MVITTGIELKCGMTGFGVFLLHIDGHYLDMIVGVITVGWAMHTGVTVGTVTMVGITSAGITIMARMDTTMIGIGDIE